MESVQVQFITEITHDDKHIEKNLNKMEPPIFGYDIYNKTHVISEISRSSYIQRENYTFVCGI